MSVRWSRTFAAALATAGLATAAGAAPAPAATPAAKPSATKASLLFVQAAGRGKLERTKSGLRLSLKVSRYTQTFDDRPVRRAGRETTRRFVERWAARGFRSDPPNAALSIDRDRGGAGVLELRRPRYANGWIHYSARRVKGSGTLRTGRFGAASLFIDDAPSGLCQGATALDIERAYVGDPTPGCPPSYSRRGLLFVPIPPNTGMFTLTIGTWNAAFSPSDIRTAGGLIPLVSGGSPRSITVLGCECPWSGTLALDVLGNGDTFRVSASIPITVAGKDFTQVPVGPNQSATLPFNKRFPGAADSAPAN